MEESLSRKKKSANYLLGLSITPRDFAKYKLPVYFKLLPTFQKNGLCKNKNPPARDELVSSSVLRGYLKETEILCLQPDQV